MRVSLTALASLSLFLSSALAHGAIVDVKGANGVSGVGIGIDASTPRDGSRRRPFQQDSSIIRDEEIEDGEVGACGRTLVGGPNDIAAGLAAAAGAGNLPTAGANGEVEMTLHQVNGDGAGPYECAVSTDGGDTFAPMQVTTNVPGRRSRSRARATAFPLVAQMPANATCAAGPNNDACIVRCRNSARAGPFGGCVVVANNPARGGAAAPPAPAPVGAGAGAGAAPATVTVTETAKTPAATVATPAGSAGAPIETAAAAATNGTAAAGDETNIAARRINREAAEAEEDEEEEEEEQDDVERRAFRSRIAGRANAGRSWFA